MKIHLLFIVDSLIETAMESLEPGSSKSLGVCLKNILASQPCLRGPNIDQATAIANLLESGDVADAAAVWEGIKESWSMTV